MKLSKINIFTILIFFIVVFIVIGYYNSYIGYYGYNKDKIRRFSETKVESLKRGTFVKELHFKIDSVKINNVFIEKGFKWGDSDEETKLLTLKDTYKVNKPYLPFQLIVSFNKKQKGMEIFIPINDSLLKTSKLKDTLFIKVYIVDTLNNSNRNKVLKIW